MKRWLILFIISLFVPTLVLAKIPNDPGVQQWAFKDTGVYNAWDYFIGSDDVVVAIIDNGFDTLHPDLRDNLWINKKEIKGNKIDDDKNGYVDDMYGWNFLDNNNDPRPSVIQSTESEDDTRILNHGTLVAGIIGAMGNNQVGIAGINWRVRLMNLKVVGNEGKGSMAVLPEAIYYAVDNGADVINISMVGSDETGDVAEAVKYAYDHGVVVVAAAGNNYNSLNTTPMYPVCADRGRNVNWVLGVSAIDETHHLASFSNTGNGCIDITAPGMNITSTVRYSPTSGLNEKYSGGWNGTSFAAPMVSGATALIKSIHPEWKADKIYEILLSTVQHTPNQDETEYANLFGAGLLQVDKAVLKALETKIPVTSALALVNTDSASLIKWTSIRSNRKYTQGFLKDIDQVSSCVVDDKKYFVTRQDKNFNVYDSKLALVSSWKANIDYEADFVCGDADNNDQLDIVLTSKEMSNSLFTIYNINGTKIQEQNLDINHDGARVDLEDGEIRIVYRKDNNLYLIKLDNNSVIKDKILVDNMRTLGDFVVADMDNDGLSEYVIGAGKGDSGYIDYLNNDGTIKRKFWAYSERIEEDMQLVMLDFNQDNNDDVASFVPGYKLIVWSGNSRKLFSWSGNDLYNLLFLAKN